MRYSLIALLVVALGTSCKSSKTTTKPETKDTKATTQVTKAGESLASDEYRIIFSFISYGGGTDFKVIEEFKKYIDDYNTKHKMQADPEIVTWGREGEVDYCFKMDNMTKAEQDNFLTGAAKILTKTKRLNVTENAKCTHKR